MTAPLPLLPELEAHLATWLPTQPWYAKTQPPPKLVNIVDHEISLDTWPKLLWAIVECDGDAMYHVPMGLRPADGPDAVLHGHEKAFIGKVASPEGELIVYDALVDSVLGRAIFDVVTNGERSVKAVRPLGAEQTNTSLVFDNRLVLKVFRRLAHGRNPDLEAMEKLTEKGFKHIAPVVATWRRADFDLAACYTYLYDGSSGRQLALASMRDLLGADTMGSSSAAGSPLIRIDQTNPALAGGDFAAEAQRLGEITGQLHLALAESFPVEPFDPSSLAKSLIEKSSSISEANRTKLNQLVAELRAVPPDQAGKAIRVHGDYYLGRALRSATGWFIFGFDGERASYSTRGALTTSPLKDVADMLRSFQYTMLTALREQMLSSQSSLESQAAAWLKRNRQAFLRGYAGVDGIDMLLPGDLATRELFIKAFWWNKAIQELDYAKAHGFGWVGLAQVALDRLLDE